MTYLADVHAERPVDATALDADHDAEVDGCPFGGRRLGTTTEWERHQPLKKTIPRSTDFADTPMSQALMATKGVSNEVP